MIDKDTLIKVTNRDNGVVGYTVPDLGNLHRTFEKGETKEIPMEELRKLSYLPGGDIIIKDCLIINNKEALEELFLDNIEPEYFYTEEDIKRLMTTGTLDEFLDCLDFAPNGVVDLIKDMAVKMPLNDVEKRDAIKEKTGFDVTKAIQVNKETEESAEAAPKARRVTISANQEKEEGTVSRRVVVSKK